jgi:hypothetical protein
MISREGHVADPFKTNRIANGSMKNPPQKGGLFHKET